MNLENNEPATFIAQMRINEILYFISSDAEGLIKAKELEEHREDYFQDLYDFSFGVGKYDKEYGFSSDTAFFAIEIVSAKSNYEKQVKKQKDKYNRFWRVVNMMPPIDAAVFKKAFIQQVTVNTNRLREIISEHISDLEKIYPDDEEELSFEGEEGARLLGITEEKRLKRMKRNKSLLKELC
ncbi:hypothetical protein [Jeotgalibacillus soli]|uniref:hypothetical protein n=1 Tax=Jeotgalibacillus soli TaxID=889306 RepID=UPI00103C1185|nr:hypothetical protein [Jeotgalibacillus soli]